MYAPHPSKPLPEARFPVARSERTVSAALAPRRNRLLAALPAGECERLLPDLEPVSLPPGWIVHGAGDRERYLYFVTAGIVSRFCVTESGASKEFAVTGNEGVIGVASFLGGDSAPSQAIVLSAGHAYRVTAERLNREFEHDGPLPRLLLRYIQALMVDIGQVAACNRHHALRPRLCRWILSCLDRLPSNELAMTQERMANMLGVRRQGVTAAAGRLQAAGVIHYGRGHVVVLDRPRLEEEACECYAVIKRAYDELLRPVDATVARLDSAQALAP